MLLHCVTYHHCIYYDVEACFTRIRSNIIFEIRYVTAAKKGINYRIYNVALVVD